MFISSRGNVYSKTFSKMLVKYTVLDEQRREAKEGKSQRQNPRSITRGATYARARFCFVNTNYIGKYAYISSYFIDM